jgi:hypothetical protein
MMASGDSLPREATATLGAGRLESVSSPQFVPHPSPHSSRGLTFHAPVRASVKGFARSATTGVAAENPPGCGESLMLSLSDDALSASPRASARRTTLRPESPYSGTEYVIGDHRAERCIGAEHAASPAEIRTEPPFGAGSLTWFRWPRAAQMKISVSRPAVEPAPPSRGPSRAGLLIPALGGAASFASRTTSATAASFVVVRDVDDRPIRITDEEAAQAPVLVGEGIDDLGASGHRAGIDGVHVVDLDRDVGMLVGADV